VKLSRLRIPKNIHYEKIRDTLVRHPPLFSKIYGKRPYLRGKKKGCKGGGYLSLMPTSTGGSLPTVHVCGHGGEGRKNIGKTADVLCERPLIFLANENGNNTLIIHLGISFLSSIHNPGG